MVNNKRTNDSYIIKLKTTSESENNIFPLMFCKVWPNFNNCGI